MSNYEMGFMVALNPEANGGVDGGWSGRCIDSKCF